MYGVFVVKPVDVCACVLLASFEENATISHSLYERGESSIVSEPSECTKTGSGSYVDAWIQCGPIDGIGGLERKRRCDV